MKNCFRYTISLLFYCFTVMQLLACGEPIYDYSDNRNATNQVNSESNVVNNVSQESQSYQETDVEQSTTGEVYRIVYSDTDGDGVGDITYVRVNPVVNSVNRDPYKYINDADGDGLPDEKKSPDKSQATVEENTFNSHSTNIQSTTVTPTTFIDLDGDGFPDGAE